MKKDVSIAAKKKIHSVFLKNRGFLTASTAIKEGIQSRDLYALRDSGMVSQIARGLFHYSELPLPKSLELFTLSVKVPNGVVCLASALHYHGLISSPPLELSIALHAGAQRPRQFPFPHKIFFMSEPAFSTGIEIQPLDGFHTRIYNKEKALVDAFKFRTRIGLNVCLESLSTWLNCEDRNLIRFHSYTKMCRMEKVIEPYLKALTIDTNDF